MGGERARTGCVCVCNQFKVAPGLGPMTTKLINVHTFNLCLVFQMVTGCFLLALLVSPLERHSFGVLDVLQYVRYEFWVSQEFLLPHSSYSDLTCKLGTLLVISCAV